MRGTHQHFVDQPRGPERYARRGVHEHALAERRAATSLAAQIRRSLEVHERKRHELGEPADVRVAARRETVFPYVGTGFGRLSTFSSR